MKDVGVQTVADTLALGIIIQDSDKTIFNLDTQKFCFWYPGERNIFVTNELHLYKVKAQIESNSIFFYDCTLSASEIMDVAWVQ